MFFQYLIGKKKLEFIVVIYFSFNKNAPKQCLTFGGSLILEDVLNLIFNAYEMPCIIFFNWFDIINTTNPKTITTIEIMVNMACAPIVAKN